MKQVAVHTKELKSKAAPDFTLVMSKLQDRILQGKNPDRVKQILNRDDIWKRLNTREQLRWAELAQAAGEADRSLALLAHINQSRPDLAEAWERRLELLHLLGRGKEKTAVLALCRPSVASAEHQEWVRRFGEVPETILNDGFNAAFSPFERLRQRQKALERYMDLFSGREDCFARQWADKTEEKQGYVPVRRPMASSDVEEHLRGRKTLGIYLLRADATVKLAVVDVDLKKTFRNRKLKGDEKRLLKREFSYLVSRLREEASEAGIKPLVEFSGGKGFHFWFFFSSPLEAQTARRLLEQFKATIAPDLSVFSLEVFPKQDHLSGKGFGNLVKLPLGVHRLTGKKSYFVDCPDRAVEAQLAHLTTVQATEPDTVRKAVGRLGRDKVVVHPRLQKWAGQFPELSRIEKLCPPLGQIISACRQGKDLHVREEKVLFQTIGFLPKAGTFLHHLMAFSADYNPHLVDYRLSRVRGTPLGCRRIHTLLDYTGDYCTFQGNPDYAHPLLHLGVSGSLEGGKAEKVENLSSALDHLKISISQVERFLK